MPVPGLGVHSGDHRSAAVLRAIRNTPSPPCPTSCPETSATISGTPAQPGVEPTYTFTVQGTGDEGQPLYQAYSITVDPNQPLTVVLLTSGSTLVPGTLGQAYAQNFFLSGRGNPLTWSVASGQLPTGPTLQTYKTSTTSSPEHPPKLVPASSP